MKKIMAVIRSLDLEKAEMALKGVGVEGVTIIKVKGYGEYRDFFTKEWVVSNIKLEVVVQDDQVNRVVDALIATLQTGYSGDGIIVVSPVEEFIKIRTGERRRG